MSDFDKTLEALASLCPQNIPEIENLPVPSLEIGDQCLLIWSDQIEVWRVKGFCADDGVDIVYDKFNAHMEVPRSELRLIGDFFNARQEEIDDLKNQLNNMETCYIEKKKEVEGLQGKSRCIKSLVEQRNLAENMLRKISVAAQKKLPTFGAALRFNDEVKEILRGES